MELIRGLHNIRAQHNGCVLTIGKFDGVHLGHQAVLESVLQKAKLLNLPAVVMVFEPQPEELFAPEHAPARLSVLRDKYIALEKLGVHRLLCVRFCAEFSSMSPHDFITNLLVKQLGVKFLVVGDDFRFGIGRSGDFTMLAQESKAQGFELVSTQSFRLHDHRISSTAIRNALRNDDFTLAAQMLGRPFEVAGTVVHGEQNGRKIGFPTANILLKRTKSPVSGVFAVKVKHNDNVYNGVANVGHRPTLNGTKMQLEAHLFDFSGDLYSQYIRVEFVSKIRNEVKFSDFGELTVQIKKDAARAKCLFAN
ncbi:riboflavin kinase [Glaciecola punicea ACAM 611]|uniref:Riboflavin biosynthesis protein n=1 Tax=Glaciecola punicea ACAM 611 TaxID=1121923 RepID=H5T804_9ALTE|nr:bifunctional riboflavin kinase/FAD synthetase [Glaciecola punicea]OFA30633.1 riboflavin biosynthesis protein RibF [Glaciecola punicea]GAB54431.1 riboflavin kinase [Glaciecola punicea ACAM 611]